MINALPRASTPLQSQRFVVLLNVQGQWRKLFSVQFERGPHGLGYFVHLPYFAHAHGILRGFGIDVPPGESTHINLREGGSTTSERLKYTHHADGNAHFSQDTKVFTTIRAVTPPLLKHAPHLFTFHFWGAEAFDLASGKDFKPPTSKRAAVGFIAPNPTTSATNVAARIVGQRIPVAGLSRHPSAASTINFAGPVLLKEPGGQLFPGVLLQPTDPQPDDFLICLTYLPMPREGADHTSVAFLSGFHPLRPAANPDEAIGAITIHYADRGGTWQEIVDQLGSTNYRDPVGGESEPSTISSAFGPSIPALESADATDGKDPERRLRSRSVSDDPHVHCQI